MNRVQAPFGVKTAFLPIRQRIEPEFLAMTQIMDGQPADGEQDGHDSNGKAREQRSVHLGRAFFNRDSRMFARRPAGRGLLFFSRSASKTQSRARRAANP